MRTRKFYRWAVLSVLLGGCIDFGGSDGGGCAGGFGANGELGNGSFSWVCDDALRDQNCRPLSGDQLPQAVANGATFQLSYRPNADGANASAIAPALGRVVVQRGAKLSAKQPGREAVLALGADQRTVLELVHLDVLDPESIVWNLDAMGRVPLAVGARAQVTTTVLGTSKGSVLGPPLLGGIAATLTSSDANVFRVQTTAAGEAELVGVGPGTATLTATAGTVEKSIAVVVGNAAFADGGEADATADADADAAAEGGSDAKAD